MATEAKINKAVAVIYRALAKENPVPYFALGEGDDALVLAYRRKGGVLEAGGEQWEALQSGVFKRCLKISGIQRGFTFLFASPLFEEDLRDALEGHLQPLDDEQLDLDLAKASMQSVLWGSANVYRPTTICVFRRGS